MNKQYKIFDKQFLNSVITSINTPCYLYDLELLDQTISQLKTSCNKYLSRPTKIHYAIKANNHPKILSFIGNYGLGADCVSGGEILEALNNGFAAPHIVFAGVGKLDWEIEVAIKNGIFAFNTESIEEITVINEIAQKLDKIANIFIRINPNIDAKTHKNISTGMHTNKFGVAFQNIIDFLPTLKQLTNVKLIGLHYHIGSQITDLTVYKDLCLTIADNYQEIRQHKIILTDVNIGGGLGVDYNTPKENPIANFDEYINTIAAHLNIPNDISLHFELGRSIIAQSGILLSKVIFTKATGNINFAIIDAGMNDLMRPALYEAKHNIQLINDEEAKYDKKLYDIVGPICESTDIFANNINLPPLKRGDYLSIETCGAYGRVLANTYNSRTIIQEHFAQDF